MIYRVVLYSPKCLNRLYDDGRDEMRLLARTPAEAVRKALRMAHPDKCLERISVSPLGPRGEA